MAFTNTKESGLEALIVKWLVEQNDYEQGTNADYNRDYAIDETRLFRFLQDTQPDALDKLGVFKTDMKKKQFLNRLQGEIAKRGVIDVLRNGVKVYPANLIMFYLTPTENNAKAKEMYEKNIFSVTRQLMYSNDSTRLALDMCVFINGLPVITFELKNQLTKQNVDDAVQQYKDDRDPRELLFQFKRCMVHFAVDDARVKFCTKLDGKNSWFLPFDKGYNDGAGNPPNPDGLMTDYLWKKILTKDKLSRIIENYAQVVVEEDPETKKKSVKQIFPRYHQLDCVEKLLADVKTLSRLNRCHPQKHDTFVLDFANSPDMIEKSFSRYYRTTLLSGETDPNKLYDLIATMEEYQVYSEENVEQLVDLYLDGAERDKLDPILDTCVVIYKNLDTEDQIKFKSSAKAFCRTYGFLGAILPYGNAEWERLSIFLNLLIPKLPSPRDDDFSEGILDVIDLDSYRLEAQESMSIKLADEDAEVAPVPAGKSGHIVNPEMDLLSIILSDFNDMFGNIDWKEPDNVRRQIVAIPDMVAKDERYQNAMKNSDKQNARMESERALQQVIFSVMADNMELFKQFQDNPSFKKWLSDMVFNMTYAPKSGSKIIEYPQVETNASMVAESPTPYGAKKE